MSLRDAGMTVVAVLAILAAIGIATRMITKESDHPAEEALESVAEDLIEGHLGLPDGSLDGMIDFSPGSPEES